MADWKQRGLHQVIGQAEILPYVLARILWRSRMKDRHLLAFIDNDSAQFALIRGDSLSPASRDLLSAVTSLDAKAFVPVWYAQCPSASNVADPPPPQAGWVAPGSWRSSRTPWKERARC